MVVTSFVIRSDKMKDYVAIVKTSNNQVDKYQDFDTQTEANTHVATYGGFVVSNPGGTPTWWVVNASNRSVTYDSNARNAAKNNYVIKREANYPSLGEQLDLLYHDMTSDKGNKTGEWYKAIAKVKSDYPKA